MRITIVYDNEARKEGVRTDWGFSSLIEVGDAPPILFDTGANGSILLSNMKTLGIDPGAIGVIVISHPHWDHTGGLSALLNVNKDVEVYIPECFQRWVPGGKVNVVKGASQICEGVFTTGELRGMEQSLAIEADNGMLVVVGCSHPGVGDILDAASRFGKVSSIVGGFHEFHDFERLRGLSLICPCHCTQHKSEIKHLFPDRCIDCGIGVEIEL